MKVRLRAVGVAVTATPAAGGDVMIDVAAGIRLDALLAELRPDDPEHMAVFVDGRQVAPADFGTVELSQGCELVLLRPLEGGGRF